MMPVTNLSPQKYKKFLYSTAKNSKRVRITVEAEVPIDVFIVQESDLKIWQSGSQDYGGIGFVSTKRVDEVVVIPKGFEKGWYLILENSRDRLVPVHFELFNL